MNKSLDFISKGISLVFHPVFVVIYGLVLLLMVNPYLFAVPNEKDLKIIFLYVFIISVAFPIITISMLYFLGLVESLTMPDRKQRIVPLLITATFYCWLYINIANNNAVPTIFQSFLLGAVIGLFMGFFINLFNKVSLHAISISGLTVGIYIAQYFHGYEFLQLEIAGKQIFINPIILLSSLVLIVGLVCSSRLYLKQHTMEQIMGGLMIGLISQVVAMRIIMF